MNNRKKDIHKKVKENKNYGLYFLGSVILLYLILFLFKPEGIRISLKASINLVIQIIPILIIVIIFMGIVNFFLSPKVILKHVGKGSKFWGWFIAIFIGIVSHGPTYVWFPLLKELKSRGMRTSLVAVFLYNRAIKIPLLPLMVHYFGLKYVLILLIYMIIASVIEGKIIEMLRA
ncbi:permease [candidate division WOR-3 bacterium]|nr:permease [candidate division WOR-3 bacterium]